MARARPGRKRARGPLSPAGDEDLGSFFDELLRPGQRHSAGRAGDDRHFAIEVFDPNGWQDYVYWQTEDRKTLKRINQLMAVTLRDPFGGIGKPEPLRHILSGAWSRRIDEANRLVYYVTDEHIVNLHSREHY